jgi:hypothetical protein
MYNTLKIVLPIFPILKAFRNRNITINLQPSQAEGTEVTSCIHDQVTQKFVTVIHSDLDENKADASDSENVLVGSK